MQVTGEALDVGSSVLLPPVVDRISLLLSLLPLEPSQLSTLSTGQVEATVHVFMFYPIINIVYSEVFTGSGMMSYVCTHIFDN